MVTTTFWATSASFRVRYPESAVFSAVSASPLRAPCVELKYSSTVKAFAEVRLNRGLDDLSGRLGHQATHPGQLSNLFDTTSSTRVSHQVTPD